jgi:multidrug resistance efflux pump
VKPEPQPSSNESSQRELVAQARAELERPEPDWLRVKALAERGAELSQPGTTPVRGVGPEVEAARAQARGTLEQIRPIVAEADDVLGEDNMARAYLDHAQQAYDNAVAALTERAAIDGFRLARESADAAHEHALALRAQTGRKLTPKKAASPFWGVFSRPAGPA